MSTLELFWSMFTLTISLGVTYWCFRAFNFSFAELMSHEHPWVVLVLLGLIFVLAISLAVLQTNTILLLAYMPLIIFVPHLVPKNLIKQKLKAWLEEE